MDKDNGVTASGLVGPSLAAAGKTTMDHVLVPREEIAAIIDDIAQGYPKTATKMLVRLLATEAPHGNVGDDYKRGQRDALSAVLSLNPTAAAQVARWAEKEPDPEGRIPFDVVLWTSIVAQQLGFETLEGDGVERLQPAAAGEAPVERAVNANPDEAPHD
jgi:hypothetical protein